MKTTVNAGTSFLSPCWSLRPQFLASAQTLEHKLTMSKYGELAKPNTILCIHPSSSPLPLSQWVPARTFLYTPDHSFYLFIYFFCWSIVDLQHCVNFCCTTKWFNCTYFAVQLLSHVWLFATQWTGACQASLSFTVSGGLLKLMSIESVMPSNYLILYCPLLLPSIFPSIRVFTRVSSLHQVAKVLELHQSFQWIIRIDFL